MQHSNEAFARECRLAPAVGRRRGFHRCVLVGLFTLVWLCAGSPDADARLSGAARTNYINWSIGSCTRNWTATRSLLGIARRKTSRADIRRFCRCSATEEADRLGDKHSGEEFMAAVRAVIPICLRRL